jgi:hypothetical protein
MIRALLRGRYGRAFLAVSTSEVAAESIGVSVYRFKVLAFVISAVTCGLAGALVSQQNQYISSDFITFGLSIFFLLTVLFGGSSVYGPLLGAIVLTLLDAFLARWPHVQHFMYGAMLLFALYAMPDGLSGAIRRRGAPDVSVARPQAAAALGRRRVAPAEQRGADRGSSAAGGARTLQGLRRRRADERRRPRTEDRPHPFADRSERRGQDDAAEHAVGHRPAGPRHDPVQRARHRRHAVERDQPPRARPHLPEPQAVRRHVRARQRHGRTARPDGRRASGAACSARGLRHATSAAPATRPCASSISWACANVPTHAPAACLTDCSAASNWRARSRRILGCCSSTNRPPASIRRRPAISST